jgi:hypothetical protein
MNLLRRSIRSIAHVWKDYRRHWKEARFEPLSFRPYRRRRAT